jgi:hypothetical protein
MRSPLTQKSAWTWPDHADDNGYSKPIRAGCQPMQPWFFRRPERIESGWWDGTDVRGDYFVAENPLGETVWIYRDYRYGIDDGEWVPTRDIRVTASRKAGPPIVLYNTACVMRKPDKRRNWSLARPAFTSCQLLSSRHSESPFLRGRTR